MSTAAEAWLQESDVREEKLSRDRRQERRPPRLPKHLPRQGAGVSRSIRDVVDLPRQRSGGRRVQFPRAERRAARWGDQAYGSFNDAADPRDPEPQGGRGIRPRGSPERSQEVRSDYADRNHTHAR